MTLLRSIALTLIALLAIGLVVVSFSYWTFVRDMNSDVDRLAGIAQPLRIVVTEATLTNLPQPAQRYFRHAGVIGQPVPNLVRLSQTGRIRSSPDAAWLPFEADEIYTTSPPGFVWRASFPSRALPIALGGDKYVEGRGGISVKLLSIFPVADEHSNDVDAASLMRYLNETMWFPAALLAPGVSLAPVDDGSFRVTLWAHGTAAEAVLSIDADGRLTNFRAQRFNTGTGSIQNWETPVGSYRQFDAFNLPSTGAGIWKLASGDFTYIELKVTNISYE